MWHTEGISNSRDMSMLAQQLSALKGLVDAAPSSSVRERLLGSHADSIKAQILNNTISDEEVKSLTGVIQGLPFTAEQQSELLVALSTSLLRAQKGAHQGTSRSQVIVDLIPYLTSKEWESMNDAALALKVKLRKLADILIRLDCMYPNEPTKVHVVSVCKSCGHPELNDPQTFNMNLKLFKGYLTDARKRGKHERDAGSPHIGLYNGNPLRPAEVHLHEGLW